VAIVSYKWDFGDNTNGDGMEVEHKYTSAGTYDVVLVVIDAEGNEARREMKIEVVQPENPLLTGFLLMILFGTVAAAGAGGLVLYWRYKRGGYHVDDVLVIYKDGRLLHHASASGEEAEETAIVASMLTAVQDFVKDSLKATAPEDAKSDRSAFLGKLEYGKKKILVEKGKNLFLAVVLTGYDPEALREQMKDTVNTIGNKYKDTLAKWDGDMESVQGMSELTKSLMIKKGKVK
jgi:hypothetical protein